MSLVLGVDPGSLRLGWGLVETGEDRLRHVAHGTLRASRGQALHQRLASLYEGLNEVLDRHRPVSVGLERIFTARNVNAALTLGQARGIILLAVGQRGLELAEYSPSEIKVAVADNGRAAKEQVAAMVGRLLGMRLADADLDSSDALAVAICHAHARRHRRLLERAQRGR